MKYLYRLLVLLAVACSIGSAACAVPVPSSDAGGFLMYDGNVQYDGGVADNSSVPDNERSDTLLDTHALDGTPPDTILPDAILPDTKASDVGSADTRRPDTSRLDATRPDSTQPDSTIFDTSRPDSTIFDTSRPDTSRPDTGRPDTGRPDTSRPDTSRPDTSRPDTSRPDTSRPDTSRPDTSRPDTSRPDTSRPDNWSDAGFDPNTVEVFGFGDSVTDGYCASWGQGYYTLLLQNDDALFPQEQGNDFATHFARVNPVASSFYNQAISGSTSCDWEAMFWDLESLLADTTFTNGTKVIVITLGGNDLIHNYSCSFPQECAGYCSTLEEATPWAESYKTRMIRLINLAKDNIPGPLHIFVANIYDPTDGVGDMENAGLGLPPWPDGLQILDLYNQKIAEICQHTGAHFVDMKTPMLGHGIHHSDPDNPYHDPQDPSHWYCSNIEDPNDLGYNRIRQYFWAEISSVLGL